MLSPLLHRGVCGRTEECREEVLQDRDIDPLLSSDCFPEKSDGGHRKRKESVKGHFGTALVFSASLQKMRRKC